MKKGDENVCGPANAQAQEYPTFMNASLCCKFVGFFFVAENEWKGGIKLHPSESLRVCCSAYRKRTCNGKEKCTLEWHKVEREPHPVPAVLKRRMRIVFPCTRRIREADYRSGTDKEKMHCTFAIAIYSGISILQRQKHTTMQEKERKGS